MDLLVIVIEVKLPALIKDSFDWPSLDRDVARITC